MRILGDSREWLAQICRGRDNKPTLFWLDAHYVPGASSDIDKCPLIEEINIINKSFFGTHVIMVDDDLAITKIKHWETTADILRALQDRDGQNRDVRIVDDVYFATLKLPEDFDEWTK